VPLFCALAFCASPASAAPFTPSLDFAYELAVEHWGEPTNCLSIDAEIVPQSYADEQELEGWATIPTGPTSCVLNIARKLASRQWFARACAVMFHEVGHLTGHEHSSNPRSIMYPEVVMIPSACWKADLWLINHPRRLK
jgi:hypothetical protein